MARIPEDEIERLKVTSKICITDQNGKQVCQ